VIPERRTLDVLTLRLGPGQPVLRVGLYRDSDGKPEELVLALGWDDGRRWTELRRSGLSLPGSMLEPLREALAELCARLGVEVEELEP